MGGHRVQGGGQGAWPQEADHDCALTEACLAFPALDAIQEGFEVSVPVDAVGGTSLAAHEAALRRMEQAGVNLISQVQMYCELQRDWSRAATVPGFMGVFQNFDGFNAEKAARS